MGYLYDDICEECARKRADKVIKVIQEEITPELLNYLENWIHQNRNGRVGVFIKERR